MKIVKHAALSQDGKLEVTFDDIHVLNSGSSQAYEHQNVVTGVAMADGKLEVTYDNAFKITGASHSSSSSSSVGTITVVKDLRLEEGKLIVSYGELTYLPDRSISSDSVVFTNGCFDLFHSGHAAFLRACRSLGSMLIVGINTDESVKALKGQSRPICSLAERMAILHELRSVDRVIVFDEATPCDLIQRIRPDVIVKGPGYSEANMPEAAIVKAYGGRVVILDGPQISSSDIVERILKRCRTTI